MENNNKLDNPKQDMLDREGYIYKITSPSGKIYIGSTLNSRKRHADYKYENCKDQRRIYNSIKKYGWESHVFEIIEEVWSKEMLAREAYWGEYYDVLGKNGLNCNLPKGGDTYQTVREETKLKMAKAREGRKLSESHKRKISQGNKGLTRSEETKQKLREANLGKKASPETRQKLSQMHKGIKQSDETIQKRVKSQCKLVFNTETGIFYNSLKEASESLPWTQSHFNSMMSGDARNRTAFIYA